MQLGFGWPDQGPIPGRTPIDFQSLESEFVHSPELTELDPERMHHWSQGVMNTHKIKYVYHQAYC
eukprot:4272244-Karenia_brevis.AAC.1